MVRPPGISTPRMVPARRLRCKTQPALRTGRCPMSNMTTPAGYAPAPVPPAPPARKRSFAGAIVLIVIGVVFLLGNMHVITWIRLWRWFAHYWPVLLILYGVVKLIEYYQAQRERVQYRGFGAGGVVMIVFLILFGLTASGIERMRGQINWN